VHCAPVTATPKGVKLSLANVAADESDSALSDWMVARALNKYNEHPPFPKAPL
jgi:hypothetical protein